MKRKKILSTSCILFLCSTIFREHRIISLAFCVYCSFNYTFLLSSAVILTDWGFTTHTSRNQTDRKTASFSKLLHTHSMVFRGKHSNGFQGKIENEARRIEFYSQASQTMPFSPEESHSTPVYITYFFENINVNV